METLKEKWIIKIKDRANAHGIIVPKVLASILDCHVTKIYKDIQCKRLHAIKKGTGKKANILITVEAAISYIKSFDEY